MANLKYIAYILLWLLLVYPVEHICTTSIISVIKSVSRSQIYIIRSKERTFLFSRGFLHCSNYFSLNIWRENRKVLSFERTILFSLQVRSEIPMKLIKLLHICMIVKFRHWNLSNLFLKIKNGSISE